MTSTDDSEQTLTDSLRSDHRALAELALTVGPTENDEDDRHRLVAELVRHFVAEEEYLYPLVRDHVPDGEQLAQAAFNSDRTFEDQLRELERAHDTDAELAALLDRIRAELAEHVRRQEPALFAAVDQAVDRNELNRLGADARGAERVAPSRPRDLVTHSPEVNKVLGIIEGFVDSVRDAYRR